MFTLYALIAVVIFTQFLVILFLIQVVFLFESLSNQILFNVNRAITRLYGSKAS
jgi:hypothetical protein